MLERCLAALNRQHFPLNLFEVLVVTDGPESETCDMLKKFPACFSLYILSLKEKKGPAAARNLGWTKARGKLVLFTNDDCIPTHGWINAMWTAYCSQPGKTVAFTGQVLAPRFPKPTDYEKNIARLENADFITANCACSKPALLKVKGFDEDFSMAWREDSALEFKLIRQQVPIHFIRQAVVVHPVRKAGWGISLKEQRKSMFNALLYKKYPLLYRQKIIPFLSVYRTLYGAVKFKTRFL